ncbi:OmpA family protein [Thalassospira sp.]|uniref:OmpA family protein n=1 Tax=Thalassospira sp. TaxID=1912094 RepID=UPI0027373E7B|nr:OmpA family protein [Thalassospira sp.]MDP2698959.1 OmpA family protein [Thalassospira sp.]
MNHKSVRAFVASLCVTSILGGCVTNQGTPSFLSTTPGADGSCNYNEAAYVIGGAIIGIGIGLLVGGDNKGLAGVAGGAAGGLAGKGLQSYLQSRCEEFAAVQKKMQETQLGVQPISVANSTWSNPDAASKDEIEQGFSVTVANDAMFATGASQPTASAAKDLTELAKSYAGTQRRVLILGHTDDTGSTEGNRRLSEERARTVANIFEQAGVSKKHLYYKGAGEDRPIASNLTAEGRGKNRRVEVVELETEDGIIAYDSLVETDPFLPSRVAASKAVPAPAAPQAPTPAKPSVTAPPASVPNTKTAVLKAGKSIDFGGHKIDGDDQNIASLVEKNDDKSLLSSIWPISDAQASENSSMLDSSCIDDTYRPIGKVMSLETDAPVRRTSEYLPGLYSTSWHDTVNGHLVGLTKVAVLEDSGLVDKAPDFVVFENYQPGTETPTLNTTAQARSYVGKNGVIYRVFLDESAWPARCLDVVFSKDKAFQASRGRIYYDKDNSVYANDISFKPMK